MNRSKRLDRKLHRKYLADVAGEVVMTKSWLNDLMSAEEGEKFRIEAGSLPQDSFGHSVLQRYKLKYTVTRSILALHWTGKAVGKKDLLMEFNAAAYEDIRHDWYLHEEDLRHAA
ncbi:MAG: hypothetical protein AAF438_19215 [Pseudomonadota bacterium]